MKLPLQVQTVTEKFFPAKYDPLWISGSFGREKPRPYLDLALALFDYLGGRCIVEIGAARRPLAHSLEQTDPECPGCNGGHSTYLFMHHGCAVHSVDLNKNTIRKLDEYRQQNGFRNISLYAQDGIQFLKDFSGLIDFLYLDAWDVKEGTPYAEAHLEAYLTAKEKLSPRHIISIDDTDIADGGKGRLLRPVLRDSGYLTIREGRQSIYLRNSP